MVRRALHSLFILAALAVASCGGSASTPGPAQPPLQPPFGATPGQWTWVDVPASSCADGSPTGFGVNPGDLGRSGVAIARAVINR